MKELTLSELLKRDYQHNHATREYTLADVERVFRNLDQVDYQLHHYHDLGVAIVSTKLSDELVEFHCHNGSNAANLVAAVNRLNTMMSAVYPESVTFYDNGKINNMLEKSIFPTVLTEINQGIDRRYQAQFILRK